MEFVTNKVNFYYDPRRQGFDAAAWYTLSGAPAISGTNLRLTSSGIVGKADIGRAEVVMALVIPTAPTALDARSWGLGQMNLGSFAMFRIVGTAFTAEVYDGYGNYKVEKITWSAAWTAVETEYKVKYAPDGWHFYIAGVEKAFINLIYPTGISATTQSAADTVTKNAHGLVDGDQVVLSYIATTTGIDDKTLYYVVNATTNTFQLSLTMGGAVVDLGTGNGTCDYQKQPGVIYRKSPMSLYLVNGVADNMDLVYIHGLDAEVYSPGITASVSVTADTEFPTASALGDGTANPTTTVVGAMNEGFNGTTWDRLKAGIVTVTDTLTGWLNTLPWAIFHTTQATRTNNQGGPLEADSKGNLRQVMMNSLVTSPYDYIAYAWNAGTFTETFTYYTGGSGGTLVATVAILYTDATKATLVSVTKS
jgi:hypothetical protein